MFYQINNYLQCIIIFILSFVLSCIFTKLLIYIQNKNKVYIYQREEVDKLHYSKEHTLLWEELVFSLVHLYRYY